MKINPNRFQAAFVQRAHQELQEAPSPQEAVPLDDVILSGAEKPDRELTFQAAVSALATSATLGGIAGLAALAQEVGQALVSGQEEVEESTNLTRQFAATLPKVEDPRVENVWSQVSAVTVSPFEGPHVFDSFFIDAQADARDMRIGTNTLKGDLADDNVLAFTIAHEEGHRQHRDTAGAAGLQALMDLCQSDEELSSLTFQAMSEGRKQNEREADVFAAHAMVKLGYDKQPILEFLSTMPGDREHPPGEERVALVEQVFGKAE